MRRVLLVRHAMPVVEPGTDPAGWTLSAAGEAAAAALRPRLPADARLVSSPEPKAVQTITGATGLLPVTDARFGEVRRPAEPQDGWRAARHAWVSGAHDDRHLGWETFAEAGQRFAAGVADYSTRSGTDVDTVVIGTHGMVLTAWLVSIGFWQPGEPAAQRWATLECPDVVEVTFPEDPTVRPG